MKNWLITGGCGFIGLNLIKRLQNDGAQIRILDNLSVGTKEDLKGVCDFTEGLTDFNETVQLVEGDITDATICKEVVKDADVVVHLAANTGVIPSIEDPVMDMTANVVGIVNVLEGCRLHKVPKFVFASSGAPLGEQEPPIHEERVPKPLSPYGASKLAGEGYCSAYNGSFDINTTVLRFSNVYGPLSKKKGSVVAKFIRQIMNGEELTVFGDGNQTRDFIYIEDLIEAIVLAANFEKGGEIFNIATNQETTVNDVIGFLKEIAGEKDIDFKVNYVSERKGEVKRNFADTTKANNVLGWHPSTDVKSLIKVTFDYFYQTNL